MRFASTHGYYELNPFPGCNQVVVSNHAYVYTKGKGFGSKQHVDRLQTAKNFGYDYIICTVKSDNLAEKAILSKNEWLFLDSFLNNETGNRVEIWGKTLREE